MRYIHTEETLTVPENGTFTHLANIYEDPAERKRRIAGSRLDDGRPCAYVRPWFRRETRPGGELGNGHDKFYQERALTSSSCCS